MLEMLNEKRELYRQQLRKNDRERILNLRRSKFMDLSDLLEETKSISEGSERGFGQTPEQRMALLIYGSHPDKLIVDETDDYLHAMMVRSECGVLGEKCKCTSDLIDLLQQEDYQLSDCSVWLVLRTTVNLALRAPKIDYELCAGLLEAVSNSLRPKRDLSEVECTALLKCLEEIPAVRRTDIFSQHRRLFEFVVGLLLKQSSPPLANRLVRYIDTVFSGCDEESRDILLQNLNLIRVLCESLTTSPETVDSVLIALSNIALNGCDMVDFLAGAGLVSSLMTIFEQCKPSTKHLVVVVFYNLILSSSDSQIIYLCQHGLMYLIDYCLVQPINLESLQLCLKILEKLVIFVSKRYRPQPDECDPRLLLRDKICCKLSSFLQHPDEFVRDIAAKIQ